MTKERKAQIITVFVLGAAVLVAVGRKGVWQAAASRMTDLAPAAARAKADPTPQDVIYAVLDAAREGDVKKYLAGYTGQMLASLRQSIAEKTESDFARYLKDTNASIKGIAITEPQTLTDREVKVRVEYVYQDRNEVQYMYLEKSGSEWKITRVDSTERVKTLVPYGTPVQ
jgi:hypothetical protein